MNQSFLIKCDFSSNSVVNDHFHAEYELIYVLKGNIALKCNNVTHQLGEDSFYMINTGVHHSWSANSAILIGSIYIDAGQITSYFGDSPVLFSCSSSSLSSEDADVIRKLVMRLFSISNSGEGQIRLRFCGLGYQLAYLLTSKHMAGKNDPVWNLPKSGPLKRKYDILRYVNDNYAQPISLSSLADQTDLTIPYISKIFKEQFGTTFLEYIQTIRLEHAVNDIRSTKKSLTRISMDNGFPNSASFIRKFKEVYGMTPGDYRKSIENETGDPVHASGESAEQSDLSAAVRAYFDSSGTQNDYIPSLRKEYINVVHHPVSVREYPSFQKPWTKLLDVGNASNLLRYDVREQVKLLHDDLGFEYIHLNNVLSPDMKIYPEGSHGKPSFTELRKVLDYIVSLGMHPYIELEAQETALKSSIDSKLMEAKVHSQLEYLYRNYELFTDLISFLIRRYGQEELSAWRISLERSTAEGNLVPEKDFFKYFSSIYKILKTRIPGISIGGPGFTVDFSEDRLESFLQDWIMSGSKPDFINMYVFPYTKDLDSLSQGRNVASSDRNYLENSLTAMNHVLQRLGLAGLETHVTIWSSTLSNRNSLNDGCFKSAYIMNSMLRSWDKCHFIGYWNVCDVCVLDNDVRQPLFGGNGLLSQNGLKKPAYHAYGFLNQLFPYCLSTSEHSVVTGDDHGRFSICCHNYKHFSYLFYQQREDRISNDDHTALYEDNESITLAFTINDLPEGEFLIRERFINGNAGNILNAWLKMSKLEELNSYEMNFLKAQSEPGLSYQRLRSENGSIHLEVTLEPQEIRLIMIEMIYD